MPSTTLWTCGCGQRSAATTCPECGWDRSAPGQPDRAAHRWSAVAGGLLVAVLVADGVVVARGVDEQLYYGPERSTDVGLALEPRHPLPVDLGTVFPSVEGWERVDVAGQTGPLSLDVLVRRIYETEADAEDAHELFTSLGFVRAHAAWWRDLGTQTIVGIEVYELGSPADAQQYLDQQRVAMSVERPDEVADITYVAGEVAYGAPVEGGRGLELIRRVGQTLVREYIVGPGADEERLRPLHDAFVGSYGG